MMDCITPSLLPVCSGQNGAAIRLGKLLAHDPVGVLLQKLFPSFCFGQAGQGAACLEMVAYGYCQGICCIQEIGPFRERKYAL